MFPLVVLSESGLDSIANHKYVAGKYTPLDNLLNPFWFRIAEGLPNWLAPNLVTLTGFLPCIVNFILAWYHSPLYQEPPSRGLAVFAALALWLYQTMDAVDGKQARRTNSSTPLGQLFDHGCDCLACISHHSMAASVLVGGPERNSLLLVLAGLAALQSGFFMAQWQEYHTGVLRTSFGPVGVTETQYGLVFLAVYAAIVGPDRLLEVMKGLCNAPWSSQPVPLNCAVLQGWILFSVVLCTISFFKTISSVYQSAGVSGIFYAMGQLIPVITLNVLTFLWHPAALMLYARKLLFVSGMVYFYFTAKMILFSMARMPFAVFQKMLVPYGALALASWFLSADGLDVALTVASVGFGLWIFLWLGTVIQELKTRLGIYAFSLDKPANKKAE